MDTTITVLGATGNVGSRVACRLTRAGARVRPVGRDPDRLAAMVPEGVSPVVADLTDPASLAPALDGADAAFLVFPSVAADAVAPDVVATLAQRVPRVVYLSAAGIESAVEGDGTIPGSHALLERLVRDSAREWTLLRASGFATNTLAWAAQTRGGGDEVRWFGPGITRALVGEDDLAAVAVETLLSDGHVGTAPHLTGPEQLTQVEQVAAIGAAIGRPLRFVDLGEDGAAALFAGMAVQDAREVVRAQMAMAVTPEPRTDEIERLLGRPATTYAQWAREHEEDFR